MGNKKALVDSIFRNDWTNPELRGVDLRETDLRGVNLRGANLTGANLKSVLLQNADLRDCILQDVDLRSAKLQGVKLDGAVFFRTNLANTNLTNVNFKGVSLNGAYLGEAQLQYSSFIDSDMRLIDLYKANLQESKLENIDLQGAYMRDVDLRKAELYKVNLAGAYLQGASVDKFTRISLPIGWEIRDGKIFSNADAKALDNALDVNEDKNVFYPSINPVLKASIEDRVGHYFDAIPQTPKIEVSRVESQKTLQALLQKLDGFHGSDVEFKTSPNTEPLPFSSDEISQISQAVRAMIPLHEVTATPLSFLEVFDALLSFLEQIHEKFRAFCEKEIEVLGKSKTLQIMTLLGVFTSALVALKGFISTLTG